VCVCICVCVCVLLGCVTVGVSMSGPVYIGAVTVIVTCDLSVTTCPFNKHLILILIFIFIFISFFSPLLTSYHNSYFFLILFSPLSKIQGNKTPEKLQKNIFFLEIFQGIGT
jgi:hypothetical protein